MKITRGIVTSNKFSSVYKIDLKIQIHLTRIANLFPYPRISKTMQVTSVLNQSSLLQFQKSENKSHDNLIHCQHFVPVRSSIIVHDYAICYLAASVRYLSVLLVYRQVTKTSSNFAPIEPPNDQTDTITC